jgi:hypothetical protein
MRKKICITTKNVVRIFNSVKKKMKSPPEQSFLIPQKTYKKIMSALARRSHKKHPRSKEFYREMQKKSLLAKKKKPCK